ncbi:hypothetical protein HMPREF1531_02308, partial [Propionibacterium sp. oral taxon 192 str. F0372]
MTVKHTVEFSKFTPTNPRTTKDPRTSDQTN